MRNRFGKWKAASLALVLGLCWCVSGFAVPDIDVMKQAERLLNQGHPVQAAALLQGYQEQLRDRKEFPYLYGLALFESGQPAQAIPFLEQATSADPMFAGARIELARAYYTAGRYQEAQKQFEYLTAQNPPPAARRAIEEYLAAIDLKLAQFRWRDSWRLEPSLGYDSNANAATELNDFLGFTLDQQSREAESGFIDLKGRGDFSRILGGGRVLELGAEVQTRAYPEATFVNSIGVVGHAGMRWALDGETRAINLRSYRLHVDGDFNNQGLSAEGSWDRSFDSMSRTGVFSRLGVLRFADEFSNRDVNQFLLGVTGTRFIDPSRRGLVTLSGILGIDDPVEGDSRYGRDLYGLRLYSAWRFGQSMGGRLSAGWQRSHYEKAFFEQVDDGPRRDTLSDVSASLAWRHGKFLETSAGVSFSKNNSNVELFSYDRWIVYLSLTRGW